MAALTDRGMGEGSCFNGSNRECSCCDVLIRDHVFRLKSSKVLYGIGIFCLKFVFRKTVVLI
jgi:hypothetical protein